MSSYLFPLNVPRGDNPLSKLTRWTPSLDLDYLGIKQPNLVKYPYLFAHGTTDMFLVGRTHTYCLPECKLVSQPYLAPVCTWNSLMGRVEPCIEVVLWITLAYQNDMVFLVGRTHHHYKPVNDPL